MKTYLRGSIYHVYFRVNGRSYRESAHTSDRQEALLYLTRRYGQVAGHRADPQLRRLSVADAVELWDTAVGGSASRGWPRKRYGNVEQWAQWIGPTMNVQNVRQRDLSRYARHRTEKGMSASTIQKEFSSVSSFFAWLQHEEYVTANPVQGARRPRLEKGKRRGLDIEDVRRLFERVRGHPVLEPAYLLAYTQGLRRSEIVAARFEHVDRERRTLYVTGSKTDLTQATLPLHPRLEEWLEKNWRPEGPIVRKHRIRRTEGEHYSPNSIENYRKEANLRGWGLPNWHLGRHTLASTLVLHGVEIFTVCKLLRHAQVTTTQTYYAHLKPAAKRDELARFVF